MSPLIDWDKCEENNKRFARELLSASGATSAEAESALVPDWAVVHEGGGWGDADEQIAIEVMDCEDGIRLYLDGPTPDQIESAIPALRWFATTGRLPRRLEEEGGDGA